MGCSTLIASLLLFVHLPRSPGLSSLGLLLHFSERTGTGPQVTASLSSALLQLQTSPRKCPFYTVLSTCFKNNFFGRNDSIPVFQASTGRKRIQHSALIPSAARRLNPAPPHLDPLPICLHSVQPTSLQKGLQGLSMKQGTLTWAKQPAPDRCRPEARREKAGA